MEQRFVKSGAFCPNECCERYGQTESHRVIRFGKTASGVQRFQCTARGRTFTETKGTLFYKKQTPRKEILETLALLAEGSRISSISRVKGIKEDTILQWLREAAEHAEAVEEALLGDYGLRRAQVDGMWAYVRRKKGAKTRNTARFGVAR